ncbi:hypothetical protein [Microbacterium sp. HJ5]
MEPLILLVQGWWWAAPAAAGVGAASYMGLTTGRRRARRLELDAARHEESQAYRALVAAKAQVRVAQADVLAARSRAGGAASAGAKRALQSARDDEKTASYALRASRARVKASYAQYRAGSAAEPLPIERLYAAHDAVNARWLAYETDIDKALAFPQVTDPRHPATVAFLRAQREAQFARPTAGRRIAPADFVRYRDAVAALDASLVEAERQAGVPGTPRAPQTGVAGVLGSVADMIDAAIPVIEGIRSAVVLPQRWTTKPPGPAAR